MLTYYKRKHSPHYKMQRDIESPYNPHEQIYISNIDRLLEKIEIIRKDGLQKLNIFSDFDYTLTRYMMNEKRADNSFAVLEKVLYLFL